MTSRRRHPAHALADPAYSSACATLPRHLGALARDRVHKERWGHAFELDVALRKPYG